MPVNRKKPDQYLLRLPEGLRDRIQACADRKGRSLNSEIVRVLEREFPERLSLDSRVTQLLGALQILKGAGHAEEIVDGLVADVRETLESIVSGRIADADDDTRKKVQLGLERWNEEEIDVYRDQFEMSLDDEEVESLNRTGRTEKF